MKKVSIIVPIFNAEPFLRQCLESIVNQSYTNLEILLVNDGSTDGSLATCEAFAAADQRITLLSQLNAGQALARNAALDIATGELVTFVDADDWIAPEYIEKVVGAIGEADVCVFSYTKTAIDGKPLYVRHLPQGRRAAFVLSSAWGKLFRRSFIDHINLRFSNKLVIEDIDFSFNWWISNFEVNSLDYSGYFYRTSRNSVTAALNDKNFDTNCVFNEVEQIIKKHKVPLRDGKYLSFYLLKLNLFLLHKKHGKLSASEYYAEWKRNDQTTQEILRHAHWTKSIWLRGEKLTVNTLVAAVEIARKLRLTRPLLWLVNHVY